MSRGLILAVATALLLTPSTGLAAPAAAAPPPAISPPPRQLTQLGPDIPLTGAVAVTPDAGADPAAVSTVESVLRTAGIRVAAAGGGLTVHIGRTASTTTARALGALGLAAPTDLPPEGYLLATAPGSVVLAGADDAGTFYAAQTFSQLIRSSGGHRSLASVRIEDSPSFPFRGGEESFYGPDWGWADRHDQVDFLAEHRMNYYFYGPAADDHTTGRGWNQLYDADTLAKFRDLVADAQLEHVKFLYRIGPESPEAGGAAPGICHARQSDVDTLVGRLEQMYSIGVRSFVISWDDTVDTFHCDEDNRKYGGLPQPGAAAEADVLNHVQHAFFDTHPDVEPGFTIPRDYAGNDANPYRSAFDQLTPPEFRLYWTGPGIISRRIDLPDAQAAQRAFPHHRLLVFDNYPVTDVGDRRQLLLMGPLENRDGRLPGVLTGFSWNEASQQRVSHLALFTEAEYAWNAEGYAPEESFGRALEEIGGPAAPWLRVLADANRYTVFADDQQPEGPTLNGLVTAFRDAYQQGVPAREAAKDLTPYLDRMSQSYSAIRHLMPDREFVSQADPWLTKLSLYGRAGQDVLRVLTARQQNADDEQWARRALERDQQRLAAVHQTFPDGTVLPVTTANMVMDPLIQYALGDVHAFDRTHQHLLQPPTYCCGLH